MPGPAGQSPDYRGVKIVTGGAKVAAARSSQQRRVCRLPRRNDEVTTRGAATLPRLPRRRFELPYRGAVIVMREGATQAPTAEADAV